MAVKLLMPKLGLNMVEGKLVEWLKQEGDHVKKGDGLYVVETDKVANEVEALEDGVLVKILVEAGETVPVRKIVGVLASPDEKVDLDGLLAEDVQGSAPGRDAAPSKPAGNQVQPAPSTRNGPVMATPLVKRAAAQKGIDLEDIQGSGPGGRILMEDLEQASTGTAPNEGRPALPAKTVPLNTLRKVLAERMARAASTIPMVTLNAELDVSPIIHYRASQKNGEKPGINAILVSAVAKALQDSPYLNASFEDDAIRLYETTNIGLAVDTAQGLMVVVCQQADTKSVMEIQNELEGLVSRARQHKSRPDDLEGSTFTITNLGALGVDSFNPIINPPEAGILGVGRIRENTRSEQDGDAGQFTATFSLTFDHRVIDGAPAARFLQSLQEELSAFDGLGQS